MPIIPSHIHITATYDLTNGMFVRITGMIDKPTSRNDIYFELGPANVPKKQLYGLAKNPEFREVLGDFQVEYSKYVERLIPGRIVKK